MAMLTTEMQELIELKKKLVIRQGIQYKSICVVYAPFVSAQRN